MKKLAKILTKPFLYREYIINKKSLRQIAKEIGCSIMPIRHYLKIYNITPRTSKEAKKSKYTNILTKEFLYNEYIVKSKTYQQIANELKCSSWLIGKFITKGNISVRTKNHYAKGKNNSSYKDGRYSKQYHCIDCGIKIHVNTALYKGGRCKGCAVKYNWQLGKFDNVNVSGQHNPNYGNHKLAGSGHFNWQGGIGKAPYPFKFNKTLKESIRERDNHQCQICGKLEVNCSRKLDVHHVDYDKENLSPNNLISLCQSCHIPTNYNRETYIEFFKIIKESLIC